MFCAVCDLTNNALFSRHICIIDKKVALKKISKRYTNSSSFRAETDALLRIYDNGGHPNISGLRDMYYDGQYYYLVLGW